MNFWNTFAALFSNFGALTWQMVVMWGIGALLIYLAIVKKMEPSLLLPMGFGAILVNLPASGAITQGDTVGPISALFEAGMSNELFPLLLRQLYPGAVTADIPLRDDRVEEVEDYIDRTSSRRVSGFLPILGGSASSPVLRLIAIQEDERPSRQCCDSFLEDLTSECGKVSTIPGLGTRGLRAVEKKLGRRHEPVAAFAANTAAAAPAAVTAKAASNTASSLALDDEDDLYAVQEYEDEDDGYEDEDDFDEQPVSRRQQKKEQKRACKQRRKQREEDDQPRRRSPLVKVLLVVFILIFVGSVGYLCYYYWKSAQNRANYQTLREGK